jgi:glycosyltransferase involved in cell wall biosynthesis
MNLLVNTLSVTPKTVGVKTFLTNLVRGFLEATPEHQCVLLCSPINEALFRNVVGERAEIVTLPLSRNSAMLRILFDQVVVPRYAQKYQDSVLITPSSIATFFTNIPQIVIVQAPLSVKAMRRELSYANDSISRLKPFYFDALMPFTLRHADAAVAVSEYLKQKILVDHPNVKEKLVVIHEGVDTSNFPKRLNQPAPADGYLLFVSTLFPYKNVDKLLRAFALVRERGLVSDTLRLKLAGKDPDGNQRAFLGGLAKNLKIDHVTDFLGLVPYEKVPALYQGAKVFVYPSSMETFGLPLLEAMSCGVPVISSDRMSVPEIVGDAGLVIAPDDPAELAKAIAKLVNDESLRQTFIAKGFKRVEAFSWHETAKEFAKLGEQILVKRNASKVQAGRVRS